MPDKPKRTAPRGPRRSGAEAATKAPRAAAGKMSPIDTKTLGLIVDLANLPRPQRRAVRSAMAPGAAALAARMEAGDAVTARLPAPPPLTAHLDPIP